MDASHIRLQILRCMPAVEPRFHDLRRRLALAFFFDDSNFLLRRANTALDIPSLIVVLNGSRFKIRADTDYSQLLALISFLDIIIDDGRSASSDSTSEGTVAKFNAQVDDLHGALKAIHGSIHDSGAKYMSRIDAKEVIEGVQNRLMHTVRTRSPPKQGVFGLFGKEDKQKSKQIQKQSDFMSKMFKGAKADSRPDTSIMNGDAESSGKCTGSSTIGV